MDTLRLKRQTISEDKSLPTDQVYIQHGSSIWFDLDVAYFNKFGKVIQNRKAWILRLQEVWAFHRTPASEYHVRDRDTPNTHVSNVCRTSAFYHAIWQLVLRSRNKTLVDACKYYLDSACLKAQQVLDSGGMSLGVADIRLLPNGLVVGVHAYLVSTLHLLSVKALAFVGYLTM